jgi:hypothetical protein
LRNILYTFFILTIFLIGSTCAQSYKSSITAEVVGLSSSTNYFGYIEPDKEFLGGAEISYSGKFRIGSDYQMGFRAGMLFTEFYYHGFHFGLLLRKQLNEEFFGILGLNSYLNYYGPSRTYSHKLLHYSVNIAGGMRLSDNLSTFISIEKTLDNIYGESSKSNFTKYLYWLFKLGLEYDL